MAAHASSSSHPTPASAQAHTPLACFLLFLEDTEYRGHEDLYRFFTRTVDLQKTVDLHSDTLREFTEYMDTHILKYSVSFDGSDTEWVPCDLMRYIHKGDHAFSKRLARFEEIALQARHLREVPAEQAAAFKKRKLGKLFLSKLATIFFLVNEEIADEDVELPHLALGGVLHEAKEPKVSKVDTSNEQGQLLLEYPSGLEGAVVGYHQQDVPSAAHEDPSEDPSTIPEVEISRFSSIIVEDEEFIFLNDLQKAFGLRLDECLSLLCAKTEFPLDTAKDPIEDQLLPLGDSVADTVALVASEIVAADQAKVTEEEFLAAQAKVVANQQPLPIESPDSDAPIVDERRSSLNLYLTPTMDDDDRLHADVLDMDVWSSRKGGERNIFGPQAALANYIGKLPLGDICIIHKDFSPDGHFALWVLKALSKLFCLSSIPQTVHVIFLVKKSLAIATFGTGWRGKVLARVAINQALGVEDPLAIAASVLTSILPNAEVRRNNVVQRLLSENL